MQTRTLIPEISWWWFFFLTNSPKYLQQVSITQSLTEKIITSAKTFDAVVGNTFSYNKFTFLSFEFDVFFCSRSASVVTFIWGGCGGVTHGGHKEGHIQLCYLRQTVKWNPNTRLFSLLETPTSDAIVQYDAYRKEKDKPKLWITLNSDTVVTENRLLMCFYSR